MNSYYDIIIIGGGASGMIAAIKAAERDKRVLLVEKNQVLGRKVLASGNGRCNLLNHKQRIYYGDPVFANTVLDNCSADRLILFFRNYGLLVNEEDDGRMYPVTYHSSSVVSAFKKALAIQHVDLSVNTLITEVYRENDLFHVISADGKSFSSSGLIVACGGSAQPKLGGTEDGYRILNRFGHTIIPAHPSLVPLVTDKKSISGLSGIRVRCSLSVIASSKVLYRTTGEMLFCEYGISGICAMQCSRFLYHPDVFIEVDFIQNLFPEEDSLLYELKRRRSVFQDQSPVSLLEGIVVERLSYAILKQAGIPLRGEPASDLSDEDLKRIVNKTAHYHIIIKGTRGFDYAQTTAGGASCEQFSPSTMQSLIVPGLFATGEVLNVDGDCGGYNLMFAFASGFLAGQSC